MDTPAHVIPAVGNRPNGPFQPLGWDFPAEVCIFVAGDSRTGLPLGSQADDFVQGFKRLPSCRTVSRSSMLRSR
jgi:hypothetical protein